ncbi:MAG: hypothetical protein WAM69_08810 [Candidatus Sulfotelmatobacter sp.]
MRNKLLTGAVILFLTTTMFAASPTGVAQVNGSYAFSVPGITTVWGYYVGSAWHYVGSGSCPVDESCQNQVFTTLTKGIVSFDGAGTATFTSVTRYDNSGESNSDSSPVVGDVWPYTVSGEAGVLGTSSNEAFFRLGSFNANGIATVLVMFINNTNPLGGIAVLQ